MAITLQSAGAGDEPFLRALYASTREEEMAPWGWPPAQRDAFLDMQFRAQRMSYTTAYPGARHEIILEDGKPVGRLYVWRTGSEVHLIDIALLPNARGRGIGAALIRELLAEAERNGGRVRLKVVTTNRAKQLYERLGFHRTGGDTLYDEMEWSSRSQEQ